MFLFSSSIIIGGWIILSLLSSTSLILILKSIKAYLPNCKWTITVSTCHFVSTWLFLLCLWKCNLIQNVSKQIPILKRLLLAFLVMTSISAMNFNLSCNSIGFYQMSKLTCIPYMIVYNVMIEKHRYSTSELLSLTTLILGVGIFTVSDVELNLIGTIWAIIAILSTAHNQMLTALYQAEYSINGPELQFSIAPFEILFGLIFSILLEGKSFFGLNQINRTAFIRLIGTCVLAIGVNLSTFGLIGKTSSITYQVVGHIKTILLLILGYIFFPSKWESTSQMIRAIVGICIAFVGVFLYTKTRISLQRKSLQESELRPLLTSKNGDISTDENSES